MRMGFELEALESGTDTGYRSITERTGYREGQATERAQSSLETLIAERRKQHVPEPVFEPEAVQPTEIADPVLLEPAGESVVEQQRAIAAAGVDEARHEDAVQELEADHAHMTGELAGHSGERGGSTGGSSGQGGVAVGGAAAAASATTDKGSQAHVGGTGVVRTASDSSLGGDTDSQNDDQGSGVQEEAEIIVPVDPEQEQTPASIPPVVLTPEDDGTAQPRVERVIVQRGEPIRDAAVNKTLKFKFGDGEAKQVKALPDVLIRRLRDDLAVMTNDDFARDLPVTSLLAAFIGAQLGLMFGAGTGEAFNVDANTRIALDAFRGIDGRTGAIERQLAELDRITRMTEGYANRTLSTLIQYSEKSRLLENALAFLVSDRFDPVRVSGVDALRTPLTGGRYREMRDHLRRQTDQELTEEKIADGRPRR